MIKRLVRFKSSDSVTDRQLDNIQSVFESIFQSKIIDGNLVKNVNFIAHQDTVIVTGLSRPYQGWCIVDQTQFARFKRSATANDNTDSRIILVSDVDTKANIWIF